MFKSQWTLFFLLFDFVVDWLLDCLCLRVLCFYFVDIVYFTFPIEPGFGPNNVSFTKVNETTFNISWALLTREKSYGKVILYDVKEDLLSTGKRQKRSPISSRTVNTTTTFVVIYSLPLCSRYNVSVRAYTKAGPGPYSQPVELETSSEYNQSILSRLLLNIVTQQNNIL